MRIGVVADIHEPFGHPEYRRFCKDVFKSWKVDEVLFIGDIVDNHAISFHDHSPDGMSAIDEIEAARHHIAKWHAQWPKAKVCIGNHCSRHYRLAYKAGLPAQYLKSYNQIFKTPGWKWKLEHRIEGVLYLHGTGISGKFAALNTAIQKRTSLVMGHLHSWGGVIYQANDTSRIFAMGVGAGIDISAYSMEYQKNFVVRPVLGAGVVIDGKKAFFEPMLIGRGEAYCRRKGQ